MRVRLITAQKVRPEYINYSMYETLCHGLADHGKIIVVDENPDIVHVFGLWNKHYADIITEFVSHEIPVVFTSLDGLPALIGKRCKMSACAYYIRKITQETIITQVCGTTEEGIVKSVSKKAQLRIIMNPSYTSLTSREELLDSMEQLYENVANIHEKRIRSHIRSRVEALTHCDDTVKEICVQMLYLKYLLHRGCIPRGFIKELASILTASDYNEDKLATTTRRLGIYKMASRAIQVMDNLGILTEGFMPMSPINDKQTRKMEQCIV